MATPAPAPVPVPDDLQLQNETTDNEFEIEDDDDDDYDNTTDLEEGLLLPDQTPSVAELPEDILEALDEIQKNQPTEIEDLMHAKARHSPLQEGIWTHHHHWNTAKRESYNPNTYTTFNFRLKKLHNLRTSTTQSTGDYIVKICFMGHVLGEYLSGTVDLVSLTQLSRHSETVSKRTFAPSINLGHELSMHLRFRDLLDNPVLLTLGTSGTNENGEVYPPFAYTCLNMIELVNKGKGKSRKITQYWILVADRTPHELVEGFPLISLDILGFTGLPTTQQLKQGNIMSIVIESMYRLPPEILDLAHHPEQNPAMEIHFSLPHSPNERASTLVFPGGRFKKIVSPRHAQELGVEHNSKKGKKKNKKNKSEMATAGGGVGSTMTTKTNTTAGGTNAFYSANPTEQPSTTTSSFVPKENLERNPIQITDGIPVYVEQRSYRHWATVLDYFPEAPYAASIVTGKQKIPRIKETIEAIGDIEKSGDSWRAHLASSDTRIVWNSLHRHYIGLEAYKQMLERLSKQTIWPLEVAVTVQRDVNRPYQVQTVDEEGNPIGGYVQEVLDSETVVIYHGVAFVDMTHLLYPGVKRSRFIYQLFPFNEVMFKAKTCAMKSAFLKTIRNSMMDMGGLRQEPSHEDEKAAAAAAAAATAGHKHGHGDKKHPRHTQGAVGNRKSHVGTEASSIKHKSRPNVQDTQTKSTIIPGGGNNVVNAKTSGTNNNLTISKEDLSAVRVSLLDESQLSTLPFIVFHIRMRRPLIPAVESIPSHAVMKSLKYDNQVTKFPRKKLVNSATAEKKFRSSVLEASADLSNEFHTTFLSTLVKDGVEKGYLDATKPASSVESIKKQFMFHLNASGRYLVLREHLRHAVTKIIQQKCTNMKPSGFNSRREFQQFLHDLYLFLVDEMHETLNSAALKEVDPTPHHHHHNHINNKEQDKNKRRCNKKGQDTDSEAAAGTDAEETNSSNGQHHQHRHNRRHHHRHHNHQNKMKNAERTKKLSQLLMFAQEAMAQGDVENSHRIFVERVAQSGESHNCWADFAVFWLARGDDRLAEIALREALLKNPKNIKALILSGVIAARHCDNRAITCLAAAVNQVPHCPELMVLLGMAHACLGNDVASQYFYKKAKFIHHILTGKSVAGIEAEFKNKAGFAPRTLANASNNLDNDEISKTFAIVKPPPPKTSVIEIPKVNLNQLPAGGDGIGIGDGENNNVGGAGGAAMPAFGKKSLELLQEISLTGKGSFKVTQEQLDKPIRRKTELIFSQNDFTFAQNPDFKFSDLVQQIRSAEGTKLPSMGPCLIQIWNVTKRPKGDRNLVKSPSQMSKVSEAESEEVTDIWKRNSNPENDIGLLNEFDGEIEKQRASIENINQPQQQENFNANVNEVGQNSSKLPRKTSKQQQQQPDQKFNRQKSKRKSQLKVYTRRTGSELIWTAHLLIKLRLFDFVDGVLARELTFNPERSIQVLYLRALSLHLRHRDAEAIGFLNEALLKAPKNNILWALRGHCYYMLRIHNDTFESYERTLKLPHGKESLQLVYLRFGTQCLEKGLLTLAKKVFLKGVHTFPSPYMWIAMGNTCYHLKEYPQAETSFAEANRLDNTNPTIWAHLSLVSLALGHKTLAEHSYKWAVRFGLKKGSRLMNELQLLHRQTNGFGSPAFARIPSCIPHQYYLQRLGKENPFEEYKAALKFTEPHSLEAKEFENSERENELIKRLQDNQQQSVIVGKSVAEEVAKRKEERLLAAAENENKDSKDNNNKNGETGGDEGLLGFTPAKPHLKKKAKSTADLKAKITKSAVTSNPRKA